MEQTQNRPQHPLRQAWREARVLALLFVVITGVYMAFSASAPPLLFKERAKDTMTALAPETLTPSNIPGDSGAVASAIDTGLATPNQALQNEDSARMATEAALARQKQDSQRIAESKLRVDSARTPQTTQNTPKAEDPQAFLARVAKLKAIDTETAKRLFDMKAATFIDARQEETFTKGHIPGAVCMYAEAFDSYVPQLMQIPTDRQIVVYCNGGECDLSHELADKILAIGLHKKVVVYTGGTEEWKAKNYPYGP